MTPHPEQTRNWRSMEDAPANGTVIEALGRYTDARAGFPRYVHFLDGAFRDVGRAKGEPLVCWAWRERDQSWPTEGGSFRMKEPGQ
jgi:hypothetical protein